MEDSLEFIPGGVTSPVGFQAGAVCAGIQGKTAGKPDLAILTSGLPVTAAAVFTTNRIQAAPVLLSRRRLQGGRVAAVVVNSGCANAFTGEPGLADAAEMAALAAERAGVSAAEVVAASTGLIGSRLPMESIRAAIPRIVLRREGGPELARALMTTDTVPKEAAVRVGGRFILGGAAKGSGMVHPDMATMLCLLTTDAAVSPDFLRAALRRAADLSFNMISIDGDTSTNDMVLLMANGGAGGETITAASRDAALFQEALDRLCIRLAKAVARDGEGATRLIEVIVKGAADGAEARRAARTIVASPLVKAAVHGNDPNWGRVVAALGRSGAAVEERRLSLYFGDVCLVKDGRVLPYDAGRAAGALGGDEVVITLEMGLGEGTATAWGCDLSAEYVAINSQYST